VFTVAAVKLKSASTDVTTDPGFVVALSDRPGALDARERARRAEFEARQSLRRSFRRFVTLLERLRRKRVPTPHGFVPLGPVRRRRRRQQLLRRIGPGPAVRGGAPQPFHSRESSLLRVLAPDRTPGDLRLHIVVCFIVAVRAGNLPNAAAA
jgi:hypothetical protein